MLPPIKSIAVSMEHLVTEYMQARSTQDMFAMFFRVGIMHFRGVAIEQVSGSLGLPSCGDS